MIKVSHNNLNTVENANNTYKNTALFENSAASYTYTNESMKFFKKQYRPFNYLDMTIINRYTYNLKANSKKRIFEDGEIHLYERNPRALSRDEYGTYDYWYIILIVNDVFHPIDFIRLDKGVLIPDALEIDRIFAENEKLIINM